MQETIYFIDVEALAKILNISLKRAHKFIQPLLFANGYRWKCGQNGEELEIGYKDATILFLESKEYITYGTKDDMNPDWVYKEYGLFLATITGSE